MSGVAHRERGAALVGVVLVLLTIGLVSHGMLLASLGEERASSAATRQLQARLAAEAAVRSALAMPAGAWMDSVPLLDARAAAPESVGIAVAHAIVRRVGLESWLVEGTGTVRGAAYRTARLAWALEPLARWQAAAGVVSVAPGAPALVLGEVDAGSERSVRPPLVPEDCAPWTAAVEAHARTRTLAPVASLPDTLPPALGLLDFAALTAAAPLSLSGTGTPAPVDALGACDTTAAWGLGDPDHREAPCGAHMPLRSAPGDLVLEGGAGQGILAVNGNLTLAAGAKYHGVIVSTGALRLEGGARVHGMALAKGGLHVGPDSGIAGSACWVLRALAANAHALRRLIEVPEGAWIGPL